MHELHYWIKIHVTCSFPQGVITTYPYLDLIHYNDVIMGAMTSQITSLAIVYSTVYSSADQRKRQSTA